MIIRVVTSTPRGFSLREFPPWNFHGYFPKHGQTSWNFRLQLAVCFHWFYWNTRSRGMVKSILARAYVALFLSKSVRTHCSRGLTWNKTIPRSKREPCSVRRCCGSRWHVPSQMSCTCEGGYTPRSAHESSEARHGSDSALYAITPYLISVNIV